MGEQVLLEVEISEQSERGYKINIIKITRTDERKRNSGKQGHTKRTGEKNRLIFKKLQIQHLKIKNKKLNTQIRMEYPRAHYKPLLGE